MINLSGFRRIVSLLDDDITHISIGLGSEPIASSVTLDNESQRKGADGLEDEEILVDDGFWDIDEGNGSIYTNAGVFCNGESGIIGTGELFCGGAINVPKDDTQTLTVSLEIQFKEEI